jgi:7-cyano-7-deazaguanine synthase
MSARRAVVLLSGGLDSATVLAQARSAGWVCHALSVHYGQRHSAELAAAARVAQALGAVEHRVMGVDLAGIGGSALTDPDIAVPESPATGIPSTGIPSTYVPARNTLLLALALGWAEVLEAEAVFVGVNAVDYSGYPDCRPAFVSAFNEVARLGTRVGIEGQPVTVLAPLVAMTKMQIIQSGIALGVDYAMTVSCYQADAVGAACGRCESCRLRREGFAAAGVPDPTLYCTRIG